MTGQQLNARISAIAGVEADYVGNWRVLLQLLERLGLDVRDTSMSGKPGWGATVTAGELCVRAFGPTLTHATGEALLKMVKIMDDSKRLLESGGLHFKGEDVSFSVALMWLSEGLIVSRREWHTSRYLTLIRGTTALNIVGNELYGVPSSLFDSTPSSPGTAMPRIIQHDRELQTAVDWSPLTNDLLARDWCRKG